MIARVSAGGVLQAARICPVCAEIVGVSGAGVALAVVGGDGAADEAVALPASDAVSLRIEQLQAELGEGPGVDAHRLGRPVTEPDLARPLRVRWPVLAGPAVTEGVAALFAYPLRLGAVRLGALTMYRTRTGPLTGTQHADALAMAALVLRIVLAMQAEAPPGLLAVELAALDDGRAEVHQAAGMVSVQIGASVADALVVLRARAFRDDRPLADLAADVVARRFRFDA